MFGFGKQKEYEKPNLIPILDKWGLSNLSTTCYGSQFRYSGYEMRGTLSDGRGIIIVDIVTEDAFWFFMEFNPDPHFSPFRVKYHSHYFTIKEISHLRNVLTRLGHEPLIEEEYQANINEAVALFRKAMA